MKLKEFRHLLNTLPLTADDEELLILDAGNGETFDIDQIGVDVDGTPVIRISLQ